MSFLPLAITPVTMTGGVLLAGLIVWNLWAALQPDAATSPGWKWWILVALTVLAFRWPALGIPHQLNPDESQLIAGAITLEHDPVFWRSVDGSTAGPFDFYPLLPAAWVDGPASYTVARLIGLAAMMGALFFLGETLAILSGTTLARTALLPLIAFLALTSHPDFIHCSTEIMPVLLYAAAGYFALAGASGRSPSRLWLVGGLLGCMPWAKLQALPMAATLWVLVAGYEVLARRPRALLPLLAGGLLPTVACFAMVAVTGQTEHLIVPYLTRTFVYVGDAPEGRLLLQWHNAMTDGYLACWIAGLALFTAGTSWRLWVVGGKRLKFVLLAGLLLVVAVWSVVAPSRPSTHHLLLLVPALVWMGGTLLAAFTDSPAASPGPARTRLIVAGLFLACCVLPAVVWRWHAGDIFAAYTQQGVRPARLQLTALVRRFSTRGEPLAIWGWRSSLYVEAGRRQATRQAHSEAQIYPSPLQGYFLRRYFEDFQAANPPVFADAVGPGNFVFEDRARAHECFPQLRDWVQARYTLVADLDGTRLYVRDDRLAGEHALPVPAGP